MDIKRFEYLLRKHITDQLAESEQEELNDLLLNLEPEIQQEVIDRMDIDGRTDIAWRRNRQDQVYLNIRRKITNQGSKRPLFRALVAAAVLLIILSGATVWYWSTTSLSKQQAIRTTSAHDIYLAQDDLPSLSLPSGKTIVLKEGAEDQLAAVGLKRMKDEQGEVYYQAISSYKQDEKAQYLTFRSAKGHTSRIVLADGSSVVLNSGSSLYYPQVFTQSSREVRLEGEAFFDVAHDTKRPFFVHVKESRIKVLGTSFNVTAYPDDKEVVATLLEGSVHFSNPYNSVFLKPGEQAVAKDNQAEISKKTVDASAISLWMDGFFYFEDQSVASILKVVKRWYDIEDIVIQDLPDQHFSGTFKRTKSLNQLLKNLQKLGSFNYQMKERRVTIMK
ncbi:FecR family protein [Sphingobacterium prati]|uniref:FecR family protein n=1 Tax=Sphingobacterium prati TaxID=2737006 RepID=UPI0015566480|nr:FecR domain-containing protein [Sphingobacterium prati]NPE46739.1 DUF4974 domain-containing protein [Sphingobacterium prati]